MSSETNTDSLLGRVGNPPILKALLQQWNVDSDEVYGRFTSTTAGWRFHDIRLPTGARVPEQFVWNQITVHCTPSNFFPVEIAPGHSPVEEQWGTARVAIRLPRDAKRLLISFGQAQCLNEIPRECLAWSEEGNLLLSESIRQQIKQEVTETIRAEITGPIEDDLKQTTQTLTQKKDKVRDLKNKVLDLEKSISEKTTKLKDQENEYGEVNGRLADARRELRDAERSIKDHQANYQRIVLHLEHSWRDLRTYAVSEVEQLHQLDLIPSELYKEFLCEHPDPIEHLDGDIDFLGALNGDFGKLTSYVQSFLLGTRGLYYERDLVSRVLTALRTHDLVILAGSSGCGKSQIVKGIADAIRAEVHIIPVRPNWTSPEDLLGYYNPLQRCYSTSPFLESLIEASKPQNQNRLYFVCLDEMNLARPEYYFADFISALEERFAVPSIQLYSQLEASHNFAEYRRLFELIKRATGETSTISSDLISDPEFLDSLQGVLSAADKNTTLQIHSRLRRTIAASLQVPSIFKLPANVRIVGTVNMDETTFQFSPKVVDRAHVIRFDNPGAALADRVRAEIKEAGAEPCRCPMSASQFGPERSAYPEYDDSALSDMRNLLEKWNTEFLVPLGIGVGFRTIRQAMNYERRFLELAGDSPHSRLRAADHVILTKLLPRFSFDGSQQTIFRKKPTSKADLVAKFKDAVESDLSGGSWPPNGPVSARAITQMILAATMSNGMFNYWL